MKNIRYHCSKECKEVISCYLDHKEVNNIVVLEVCSLEDLTIEILPNEQLVAIISNGDYIFEILDLKPRVILRKSKLNQDLELLEELEKKVNKILEFKSGHFNVRINVDEIMYIESFGHYLQIHTISAKFIVRDKLKDVLKQVQMFEFRQIHKSYVVNMNYVEVMNNQVCILSNKEQLNIGRKYRKQN